MIISKTYIDNLCFTPDSENGTWISCIFTIKNYRRALCYKSEYEDFDKILEELYKYIWEYEDDKMDK